MGQLFVQRGNAGVRSSSALSSSSANKVCTIQQNNGKRISTLLNDLSGVSSKDEIILSVDKNSSFIATEDMHVTTLSPETLSRNATIDHILNLKLTNDDDKKKKTKNKETKRMKKQKKASRKDDNQNRPRNAMEFEREWKLYCHSTRHLLNYLTMSRDVVDILAAAATTSLGESSAISDSTSTIPPSIPNQLRIEPEQFSRSICKVEINSNIMGSIIQALEYLLLNTKRSIGSTVTEGHSVATDAKTNDTGGDVIIFAYRWLYAFTQCGRFGLNIEFLEEKQKQSISTILRILESQVDDEISLNLVDGKQHPPVTASSSKMIVQQKDIAKLHSQYKIGA